VSEIGSGLSRVSIYLNNNPNPEKQWTSFDDPGSFTATHSFTAGPGESYDIEVKSYDKAGNMGNAYMSIYVDPGGFILHVLGLTVCLTEKLNVWIKPDTSELGDVAEVEFVLDGRVVDQEGTAYDDGEGYFRYSFDVPTGFYSLSATYKSPSGSSLETYNWPCKILFINTL